MIRQHQYLYILKLRLSVATAGNSYVVLRDLKNVKEGSDEVFPISAIKKLEEYVKDKELSHRLGLLVRGRGRGVKVGFFKEIRGEILIETVAIIVNCYTLPSSFLLPPHL